MTIKTYTNAVNTKATPQQEPIPGREAEMKANNAGGYSFTVDDWARLRRFLILGSEGGTYYIKERALTLENAQAVKACIAADGPRVVREIVEISDAGRAPKNDPAIFALVMCQKLGDPETRSAAASAFSQVVRIGTHLFAAAEAVKTLGGWGRGTQRVFEKWYTGRSIESLAHQVGKYQQRNGWSHRDLLRKLHIKPANAQQDSVFRWVVGKLLSSEQAAALPEFLQGVELAMNSHQSEPNRTARLIRQYKLPRECVRTEDLNDKVVWEALLEDMPVNAMIRNLGKMTSIGLLEAGNDGARHVIKQLSSVDALKKARVHPMQCLFALRTYAQGHGEKGSLKWTPVTGISDALDAAFYTCFGNVVPTGKRIMLALDVSSSMHGGRVAGTAITAAEGAAAMALVTLNSERPENVSIFGFGGHFQPLEISHKDRLDRVLQYTRRMDFGTTDCALPMKHATKNKLDVDTFCVYTDSETGSADDSDQHPSQALVEYRGKRVAGAKLAVIALSSNGFTIADPKDPGMMDVAGFDAATPNALSEFISM